MFFHLDDRNNTPIWEQIVNQTKEMILKGILAPHDKLLSVRELSSTLLINPNTVSKAYQELERQGVIESRRGKGTFVAANMPVKIDEDKTNAIKQALKLLIMESSYLGIERHVFLQWVDGYLDELGGGSDVNRNESKKNH